jgi:hypothetical protein
MIFNYERKITIDDLIKESGLTHGIVLEVNTENAVEYMIELNISSDAIGVDSGNKRPRYIFIGRTSNAKHGGRIKVSERGKTVKLDGKVKFVSIYVANEKEGIVNHEGSYKDVNMSSSEIKFYEGFCLRHNNLIQFLDKHPELETYVEVAIIKDERLYNSGVSYVRDKDGNLQYYEKRIGRYGAPEVHIITENIEGGVISDIVSKLRN